MKKYLKRRDETLQSFFAKHLLDMQTKMATMREYEIACIALVVDKLYAGNAEHGHLAPHKRKWPVELMGELMDSQVYAAMEVIKILHDQDTEDDDEGPWMTK